MTEADLAVLARAVAPVIKDAMAGLMSRVAALEQRAPVPGRDGLNGRDGASGPAGERGPQGEKGLDGAPGRDGVDGVGVAGPPGPPGPSGEKGVDGLHGKDGAVGERGETGPQGEMGAKGLDGKDGADGITMDVNDLQAVDYDGERTVTLTFQRGEHVKTFPITFAIPLYRDYYVDGKQYEVNDVVTWAGGLYIAKASTTVQPNIATKDSRDAWRLISRPGKDGKQGPPGPPGPQGPRGEQGERGPDRW